MKDIGLQELDALADRHPRQFFGRKIGQILACLVDCRQLLLLEHFLGHVMDRDDQMAASVVRTKRRVTWAVEQARKLDDSIMEKLHANHDQAGVLDYLDETVFSMK